MNESQRLLRLHPALEYQDDKDGRIVVSVRRGASTTGYTVDAAIRDFLECFREPASLEQVADRMAAEGYERAQAMRLGEKIVKTPMLEFAQAQQGEDAAERRIESLGLRIEARLKERKYDGVYRV